MPDPTDRPVRTRFAPSPTGYLHVGGARTALFNWLFARHHGGSFILRVEDTDEARNTDEAIGAILDGMRWLGLDWDEGPEVGGDHGPYFQSERKDLYDRQFAKLEEGGFVYADPDGGAMRFKHPDTPVTVDDAVCGTSTFTPSDEPDMTLRRPDGSYIFHFVNVVDDIEMGMTHVFRGEDHLSNTWKHLLLYDALGATPPQFAHLPLILNPSGSKMSKRDEGASVGEYRSGGFLPEAVLNYLALLGWNPKDDSEKMPIAEIIERFGPAGINRSNAKFDLEKCRWLSGQYLAELEVDDFADRALPFFEDGAGSPELARLFHNKVRTLAEVPKMAAPALGDDFEKDEEALAKLAAREDAPAALAQLAEAFGAVDEWTADHIKAAVVALAEAEGTKMGGYMFPCRVATTGQSGGPDLMPFLQLIGKERTIARLRGA